MKKAVLITGNPYAIEKVACAPKFYDDLEEFLTSLGMEVTRNPGEIGEKGTPLEDLPTSPPSAEDGDIWVAHSRGVKLLAFAPESVVTVALGAEGGINHPDDNTVEGKMVIPNEAHFTLTDEMKEAIKRKCETAK